MALAPLCSHWAELVRAIIKSCVLFSLEKGEKNITLMFAESKTGNQIFLQQKDSPRCSCCRLATIAFGDAFWMPGVSCFTHSIPSPLLFFFFLLHWICLCFKLSPPFCNACFLIMAVNLPEEQHISFLVPRITVPLLIAILFQWDCLGLLFLTPSPWGKIFLKSLLSYWSYLVVSSFEALPN